MTPQPVRLRRADVPSMPPGVLLRVRRGLLPLYWWRDVPVLTNVRHELTVFERYLLEMALTLGRMTSADVEEVLGLPPEFLDRGAWRLTASYQLKPVTETRLFRPIFFSSIGRFKGVQGNVQRVAEPIRGIGQFDLAVQLLAERFHQPGSEAPPGRYVDRRAVFFGPGQMQPLIFLVD